MPHMRGSRKFCQRGSKFDNIFFLSWWGDRDPNVTINGPSSACQQNGVSLAGRWWPNIGCWLGSFVIFRRSGPVLLRNTIFLWFFRGSQPPVLSSGSAHASLLLSRQLIMLFIISNAISFYKIQINVFFSADFYWCFAWENAENPAISRPMACSRDSGYKRSLHI